MRGTDTYLALDEFESAPPALAILGFGVVHGAGLPHVWLDMVCAIYMPWSMHM